MFYLDPLYLILALPGLLLGLWAQMRVKGTFNKYARVRTARNLSGAEIARHLLDNQGLQDVRVEETKGFLSDHYDPRARVLRNSSLPLVTIAGYAFGAALGGAVLLETVFTWPGLGLLMIEAIRTSDNMTVMGVVIFSALAVIIMNFVVDVLYALIDPRIRHGR